MTKLTKISLFTIMCSLLLFSVILNSRRNQDKTFVILTTNDIHAQIDKFPALAAAVEACRDTIDVILVDAGDRWTGNAFVDLIEHYSPMYELTNKLQYDVTIYGNHEFDKGQAYVAVANRQAQYPILGANIISDTTSFPQPAPFAIIERKGKKIAFVGITGNYDANGHPSGKDESYEGIRFTDPHASAGEYGYLADECDMVVLVSHSGLDRDIEFAQSAYSEGFDYIVSAHSHDLTSQSVNGKLISQTGNRLKNIGAATVTINRDGEVAISHRNISLADYTPAAEYAQMVEEYYNNPMLNAAIGHAGSEFNTTALQNLFAQTIRNSGKADLGLYHAGGVRLETIPQGEISMATILNIEPFSSQIALLSMTTDNLKELIMTKFNDTVNIGESHRIDLILTSPYTVITDSKGEAIDVIFPELDPKKSYKVATGDYIFKTYRGLNYSAGAITETLVTTALENYIRSCEAIEPSSVALQEITKEQ